MLIGHYGVAFAARGYSRSIPLWVYFIAVQWVDIVWCVLVLFGIERVHIQPGVNPSAPLVFDYYPYTHSLLAGILWSVLAYGVGRVLTPQSDSRVPALLLALAVLSHWVLDLVVHLPDLDLVDESYKVGLGLWRYPALEMALEFALVIAGLVWYLRTSPGLPRLRRVGMVALCVALGAVQLANAWGPPPSSVRTMALSGLAFYLLAAALARAAEGPRRR